MRRFPWILTVLTVAALIALVSLGAWQVRRMAWKEGLMAQSGAVADAAPTNLADAMARGMPDFAKVRLTCPGLDAAPFVELRTIEAGVPGVRLISACPASYGEGGEARQVLLLIDRGFVAETISARPPETGSDRAVVLTAQVRRPPTPGPMTPAPDGRTFFARDVPAMARALAPSPDTDPGEAVMLFALTPTNPEWAALKPSAPPPAFSNNHLGYALTWFGLAIVLAGFYVALLRRRLRKTAP